MQNIPEGTSVAIPLAEAPFSRRQLLAAVLTSALQPVGALAAFLMVETIHGLLPVSFAFAAGAMLALVATDLLPRAIRSRSWRGPLGVLAGAAIMLALSAVLGMHETAERTAEIELHRLFARCASSAWMEGATGHSFPLLQPSHARPPVRNARTPVRRRSLAEIMPAGWSASGWTAIRCVTPCSAITSAARLSDSFERIVTRSVLADIPGRKTS